VIREKLIALRERRALLVSRAEYQREGVIAIVERAEVAMAWFDRARAFGRTLRANPLWVVAGVAVLVALRPRRMFKLFATGFSLWRGWRSLRASIERYVPRQAPVRPAA
jgi:hypothetical protein